MVYGASPKATGSKLKSFMPKDNSFYLAPLVSEKITQQPDY